MKKQQVIFYDDELNNEFAGDNITPIKIDKNYRYYSKSLGYKILHFFYYRMIATPLAYLYLKCKFRHKIIGKSKLKPYKKKGYFLYGNHTQNIGDAVIPSMIVFPKDAYVIVHANNVSMPVLGKVNRYLGALPLPDDLEATKNFLSAMEKRLNEKNVIVIYPEAHIWPYYTKIRPFTDKSFRYPANMDKPVFCFVNTYKKRKNGKAKLITYIDGPFFADTNLSKNESKKKLRDEVYATMVERSKLSDIEIIKYVKKEESVND